MIEIIPNWHPVAVHFTVALVTAATLFVIAAFVFRGRKRSDAFHAAAAWSLWLGAAATILTIAAGLYAYGSVTHDTVSHAAMTDHRNWAFATAALIWFAALWSFATARGTHKLSRGPTVVLFLATVMVGATAYKGGDLVYRYGLGVQSLPAAQSDGKEDGHDHDHGEQAEKISEPSSDQMAKADHDQENPAQSLDPAQTADAFHAALVSGDKGFVASVLAEDVVILESGHAQKSRAEYMSGHMISDMAFLAGIDRELLDRNASEAGDLAWVITHSRMTGTYNDTEIDMRSREMLVMRRNGTAWEIELIHWGE